jgi:uncharacterized protein
MQTEDKKFLLEKTKINEWQIDNIISLFNERMSIPFISRYRKEKTGSLDEVKITEVREYYDFLTELNERKKTVLKTIESQKKLTPELELKIKSTYSKSELEDLYLPYKPKKRTKATIAKEKGLEPLAELFLDENSSETAEKLAEKFISKEKKVNSIEEAIEGAGFIIAERFSENSELRQFIRKTMSEQGILIVEVTNEWKEKRSKFEQYYDYKEPVKSIPSHRILAIRRGEKEKVLKSKIIIDSDYLKDNSIEILYKKNHPKKELLEKFFDDSLKRLIYPSIELEVRLELKKRADEEAITVFASNLENLLLSPPAGNKKTIGVDPGFRTGCKLAVLEQTGKLLDTATIYPTKPHEKIEEAKKIVLSLIKKYEIEAIAIGNGTASRETKSFFKQIIDDSIIVSVVNEAGASIYSASDIARKEFPDYDLTIRGAVSIGRRFQDPLAELVKIEPKAIGVGQYQHDVNQSLLKKRLDNVVISVVNRVGVNINSASEHLLKYVSGIGPILAKNIVEYRDKNGMFKNRDNFKKIKSFGDKAFQQSAGFLRITNGDNPLDKTGIHPETYFIVENIANSFGVKINELINNREIADKIEPKQFINEQFGIPTISDIIKELKNPGRDPRKDFEVFEFDENVKEFEDLEEGIILKGVITNVTNFGAFVDIGVHQDGLIHISEISHNFIKSPEEVLSVGDKVKVKVISIDRELKRIGLSIKALTEYKKTDKKRYKNKQQKKDKKGDSLKQLINKWGAK